MIRDIVSQMERLDKLQRLCRPLTAQERVEFNLLTLFEQVALSEPSFERWRKRIEENQS